MTTILKFQVSNEILPEITFDDNRTPLRSSIAIIVKSKQAWCRHALKEGAGKVI